MKIRFSEQIDTPVVRWKKCAFAQSASVAPIVQTSAAATTQM